MQTFLPHPDLVASISCLDNRRLGKQRVEARQILRVLIGKSHGWQHHPAVLMWRGYEEALCLYGNYCIAEWVSRGHRNTMEVLFATKNACLPPWFGDALLHASHRSNLLRKDSEYYGRYGWTEPPDLPYVWPVRL